MRRKKKNEKIDIYTALMLPLMTLFLLNMGLVATTWAWYTASVSTGVNSITAGPQLTVTVTNASNANVECINGKYVLQNSSNYKIEMSGGSATTGYVVLMDIEDGDTTNGSATSLLDLLFTPVNAGEETGKKYYVELTDSNVKLIDISVPSNKTKTLSISCLWKENEGFMTDIVSNYQCITEQSINLCSTSYTINLLDESGNPLKQSEVNAGVSTFSGNVTDDHPAVITEDDTEETQVSMLGIDGYELVSVNGEAPKDSYLLVEGQENVFNAVYKKIDKATEQNGETTTDESVKNTESNNVIAEDDGANVEISEQTNPVDKSTESSEYPELVQETMNTAPEQPETVPQEQQQNETTEVVDDVPVSHSESTSEQESTEVVENVQGEI